MKAGAIISRAADIVAGPRAHEYGDIAQNQQNIADLWNAFFGDRLRSPITASEAALLMILLKVARTKGPKVSDDTFVDLAGYAGVAGEALEALEAQLGLDIPMELPVKVRF